MSYTLIYFPGCSTCRKGLALLQENGVEPVLRKYMDEDARLSADELREITRQLGEASPRAFLRAKTAREFDLAEDAGDDAVYAAMAANPKLIQRPIGIKGDKAVLGRPIDDLLKLV